MNRLLLHFITFLHILFICFIVFAPFVPFDNILILHFIITPFLMMHWLSNNNTCALTIVERNIRQKFFNEQDDDNCFTCKLIEPVYDITKNNNQVKIIYSVTLLLFLVSACRVYLKYKNGTLQFNYTCSR